MNNGWIKLHRSLQDHWLWHSKEPFDKRSAWIDLLMLANFTDLKVLRKGELKQRSRGEVNTSILWLADRWRWDRRKVKRFLMVLERDGMVSLNSTRDGTTVTIENYGFWQDECTTNGATDGTTDGTTDCTPDGTHDKKDKKVKERKNNNITVKPARNVIPPTLDMVQNYIWEKGYNVDAEQFIDYYNSKGWVVGKSKMKDWQASVRTWNRNSYSKPSSNPFAEMLQKGEY